MVGQLLAGYAVALTQRMSGCVSRLLLLAVNKSDAAAAPWYPATTLLFLP
jgi:hypothetical protein